MKETCKRYWHRFFDIEDDSRLSGYEIFFIFMICNVLGYCIEMVFGRVKLGFWESRQSLVIGPFGLAYGIGGVLMSLLLHKDHDKAIWKVFIKTFLIGTIAEYIFSLGQELVFGYVSWDYSNVPLNINGRVCLLYSLFWGVLGVAWVKMIFPVFMKTIHKIPIKPGKVIFWVLFVFITADIILSCEAVSRQSARQMDIPPSNRFEEFLDDKFDDDFLAKVYANAKKIE